jgi:hypothetical protein
MVSLDSTAEFTGLGHPAWKIHILLALRAATTPLLFQSHLNAIHHSEKELGHFRE